MIRHQTPLTAAQLAEVKRLASAERRSVGNMLAVLVGEGLNVHRSPLSDLLESADPGMVIHAR